MTIICSFIASILEEINLVSKLIIMRPDSNITSIINNSVAKGFYVFCHEFGP